jgi:hypothetical protein
MWMDTNDRIMDNIDRMMDNIDGIMDNIDRIMHNNDRIVARNVRGIYCVGDLPLAIAVVNICSCDARFPRIHFQFICSLLICI